MNSSTWSTLVLSLKPAVPVVLLALFWTWETWRPYRDQRGRRWGHALHNVGFALVNTVVLGVSFGLATAAVAARSHEAQIGFLYWLGFSPAVQFLLALFLLDAWMYLWHRANHAIPFLWRFHRTHHSDNQMDVTTATRFHIGEHAISSLLRLGLIPLLGLQIWHIVVYETCVIAVTQFHHANISLGRADRWLRFVLVTPNMHKVHHSRWRPETDSNYSVCLSLWDRIGRSFRMRDDLQAIRFGLDDWDAPHWQSFVGMLKTPFVRGAGRDVAGSPMRATPATFRGVSHSAEREVANG